MASIRTGSHTGSQQSTTSIGTSLENRGPGRQRAKEDIAIKDVGVKNVNEADVKAFPVADTIADRDDSPAMHGAEPPNKDDASAASAATSRLSGPAVEHSSEGSNNSADKPEDASGGSSLGDSLEDELSSILRDVYSSGGEASKVADRCCCKEPTKSDKSRLPNEELESHSEGCPSASKNARPAMIIKPLPLPPKNFKPKGIMKL